MNPQERFLVELEGHRKILFKVASLYCANAEDRQDLVQEIAIQLWRSHASFDGRSRFSTWAYRVALNVAISWVRSDVRSRRHVMADESLFQLAAVDHGSIDASPDLGIFLQQVVGGLDELDRALVLLYLEGQDHESIAAILGLTATNVATKLNRIRTRLQLEHGGSGT